MAHKLIISILSLFLFCSYDTEAQINAVVIDQANHHTLSGATINLKSSTDSTLSVSTVTDANGHFSFSPMQNGSYLLNINFTGYKKSVIPITINEGSVEVLPDTVALQLAEKTLSAITVSGKKDFISMKADKITLNVAQSPIASTGNAYEAILRAPGIAEQNNSLSFRGKNVSVLINGRIVHLSGNDLKTMLGNTPATNIEKIEILPDPSAKYDASGGSVINIIMAKNKNYGFNGNFTLGAIVAKYFGATTGTSLNYRNKDINIYGSYHFGFNKQYYQSSSNRLLENHSSIHEDKNDLHSLRNNSYSVGADYDLGKNNTVGILFRGYTNSRNRTVMNHTTLAHVQPETDSFSTVTTTGYARYFNPTVNLYYKTILDTTGKELTLNADYFSYAKKWNDEFITNYFDNNKQPYSVPYLLRDHSPAHITVHSFSADYVNPVKNGSIEAGIKSTFTTTDNDVLWEYQDNENWKKDPSKTNHFIYKENINAAYLNFNKAFGDKYELTLGLRAENTNNSGNSVTLNQIKKHSYLNLFPNTRFTYNKDDNNSFSISYRKSIYRFGFSVVNPFVIYQSQYSYYKGNPNIEPEIDHNFDLSYSYKQGLIFGVNYTHILKDLAPVYLKGPDNILISSQENLNSGDMLYFYNNWSQRIGKIWTSNLSTMFGFLKYNISTKEQQATNSNWVIQSEWNNTFAFKQGWNAELSASYLSPYASGIYRLQELFSTDVGISKSLLKKKASIKLSVSDLFNTYHQITHTHYQGVIMNQRERNETRFFRLQFTWKFGNKNVKRSAYRESKVDDVERRVRK